MTHDAHSSHGSDTKAAFIGLVGGAIALLIILTAMVKLTNRHYESHNATAEAHK
jgi:hypothetical protein